VFAATLDQRPCAKHVTHRAGQGCRSEESRSFPTSSSGIRDSSRAPDTRAGMTEKFDRADVRVTILCRTQ
jgi:hypothetical protein